MNDEEFENELSEDDSDYNPEKEVVESLSENSGPEANDPENSDDEGKTKNTKKRKKATRGRKAKPVESEDEEEPIAPVLDAEAEKRKADALWEDFLSGSEIPLEPKKDEISKKPATSTSAAATSKPAAAVNIPKPKPKEIFEFAGETIEIPSKSKGEQQTSSSAAPKLPAVGVKRASSGGGISSILGQLAKKNKLSVLEKTKMDWDGFKDNEGIGEELQTHNRGREG